MEQTYKSLYFPEIKDGVKKSRSLTLAFSENEKDIYNSVKNLSSYELRNLLSVKNYSDLKERAKKEGLPLNRYCLWKIKKSAKDIGSGVFKLDPIHTTFRSSKELPLQSWYPYLEGYSPEFVEYIIDEYAPKNTKVIYDPFSGTGTTPLTASEKGLKAYYSEVNPLLQFLTKTKSRARNSDKRKVTKSLESLLQDLEGNILNQEEDQELKNTYFKTFQDSKFFQDDIFSHILKTKSYINNIYFDDVLVSELLTTAVIGSLIESSFLKRQGDLRFKRPEEIAKEPDINYFDVLKSKLENIISDLSVLDAVESPTLISEDARKIGKIPHLGIDAVITSPPYLNGTNYFRNTKVELWFLGYLKDKKDLNRYRRLAVTAGINDVSLTVKKDVANKTLHELINKLEKEAYDKRIPKMVNDYFADMKNIFYGIKKHLNKNAVLAIDLGDSIYSGIHVKTDDIFIEILQELGYEFKEKIVLRKRQSNSGQELSQVLLIFSNTEKRKQRSNLHRHWNKKWENFKKELPHHEGELSKRNWGDALHSLCSYQGKLKPSIANQLVNIFVPENGSVLDIFGGVGTIPLEAAIQGKCNYSFDISPTAVAITRAKLSSLSERKVANVIKELENYIKDFKVDKKSLNNIRSFGLNKNIADYYHPKTLNEIISARSYFNEFGYDEPERAFVMSALMHILHGNRPYALSRRSHGITPFAPSGDFEYKNLIEKLKEKVTRSLEGLDRENFREGISYYQDVTKTWPTEIQSLDAIITSPPFFDSTRFYAANWMRLWFAGWDKSHFKTEPVNFIDELQKKDMSIYDNIFMQARERIKSGGVFVMHLGKSHKCNMAEVLAERAKQWFEVVDVFEESVENGESHGIKDRGSVKKHQYLVLV